MKQKIVLSVLIISLYCLHSFSQKNTKVSGYVRDKSSAEALIGAAVIDSNTLTGIITDNNGYFNIATISGNVISISYVGYESFKFKAPEKDTFLIVPLNTGIVLSEVVVTGQPLATTSLSTLLGKDIMSIPGIAGKPDIGKSLQFLSGINAPNEGSSNIIVRGGDPGQNMYLFDECALVHVNHLGGFLSVFNPDIINNIEVYKGNFPVEFGDRLSSIVSITQREGNAKEFEGNVSIGITDASLALEGPLKWESTSYIVTARKTLFDPLMAIGTGLSKENPSMAYGFHDINGKITWKPNPQKSISFNIYQGDDYLNYWKKNPKYHIGHTWGNVMSSLHYKKVVSPDLFANYSISYSRYRLKNVTKSIYNGIEDNIYKEKYLSVLQSITAKAKYHLYFTTRLKLTMGIQAEQMFFIPNYFSSSNNTTNTKVVEYPANIALFASGKFNLMHSFTIDAGIRNNLYHLNSYNDLNVEPRLFLLYKPTEQLQFEAGYSIMHQHAHMLQVLGDIMENEIWFPATKNIPPAKAEQYTLGWQYRNPNKGFSMIFSLYHKTMNSLIMFKDGYASLKGDANWNTKIIGEGKGFVNGFEVECNKTVGVFNLFGAYSYAISNRKYPEINNGNWFNDKYDRPHTLSVAIKHSISDKLTAYFSFHFQSGLPYTPVLGKQLVPVIYPDETDKTLYDALIYGDRNSERMRTYHRADLALTYKTTSKKGRLAEWSFSVYNLYNRKNPYYYYYNNNITSEIYNPLQANTTEPLFLYQKSYFPIIPNISYKLYFDKNFKKEINIPIKQKIKNWMRYENE